MEVCLCLERESVYEYLLMQAQVAMSKALEERKAHPPIVQALIRLSSYRQREGGLWAKVLG